MSVCVEADTCCWAASKGLMQCVAASATHDAAGCQICPADDTGDHAHSAAAAVTLNCSDWRNIVIIRHLRLYGLRVVTILVVKAGR